MTVGIELTGAKSMDPWAVIETMLTQRSLSPRVRERLEMVKAAYVGDDGEAIVRWIGRTGETVRRWLLAFGAGGVEALADARRGGRPRRADDAYLAALVDAVETDPRALGLAFDPWTTGGYPLGVSVYLEETTGTVIAPGWLRVLLGRQQFACGRAQHRVHHLQNAEERATCRDALHVAKRQGRGKS